jgi:hypothetical protein
MTSTPSKKPRAKRSATTAIGRSVLNKQRQALAREQARVEEQKAKQFASRKQHQVVARDRLSAVQQVFNAAMQRSVVKRTNGVLISEGVNVPVNAIDAPVIKAWTDFYTINIQYPIFEDRPELTAAIIRGLMYHEGGHIRFTVAFDKLVRLFYEEQGWFTPAESNELTADLLRRTGLWTIKLLHTAWNMLEDQRMETAVVSDSPRKAAYFAPMVLEHLLSDPEKVARNWMLLIWRRYLSHDLRTRARGMFVSRLNDAGLDGEDVAKRLVSITNQYVRGTTASQLMYAVIELAELLPALNINPTNDVVGEHRGVLSKLPGQDEAPDFDIPISPDMEDEDEDESTDDGQDGAQDEETDESGDEGDNNGNEEGEDDAADGPEGFDDGDTGDDTPSDQPAKDDGDGAGGTSDDELTQDDLDEALRDAKEERAQDEALAEDVRAFNEAKNTVESLLPAAPNSGMVEDNTQIAIALNTAEDLRRAFEAATVNVAPNWQEEQKRGIINVLRYETRQPGDTSFFKNYNDNGNPGFDIAVTVMLDVSGSMHSLMDELAQAAYACKMACQGLGILCTVVLWNDRASMLWDANEQATYMPKVVTKGGTDPTMALEDLNHHVHGKDKHVVLIMTDGEWEDDVPNLSTYDQPGRYFVGCSYGYTDTIKGAHVARKIRSLLEVPMILEQALVECVR